MIDRLLASRFLDTAYGAFAIAVGAFVACCLLVGMAVVFHWIAGVI